jgi:5-methylcytosine-specific restriction endonuclease McrA
VRSRAAYMREYQRKWIAARRAEWFAGKACAMCGSKESLELDHIIPALKVDNHIWSWSKQRRDEELAKCQALCEECHKKKTAKDRGYDPASLKTRNAARMRAIYTPEARHQKYLRCEVA